MSGLTRFGAASDGRIAQEDESAEEVERLRHHCRCLQADEGGVCDLRELELVHPIERFGHILHALRKLGDNEREHEHDDQQAEHAHEQEDAQLCASVRAEVGPREGGLKLLRLGVEGDAD
eukprot:CAMPEP_0205902072 /NCGR_PEP_ID=MMETSP1083-20121108/28025_1 /ASSEMBLY_ACC=CAM_ASM_000430 /TAXON_ID=97485 /ORGANISM="Prymnesium parvum, Strain Texoma1" /LENGTH=119 /DNA_ID=CAMNT_0053267653 /DNA_START=51 /DNA_END=411 /DNA_ORIENTATION=+